MDIKKEMQKDISEGLCFPEIEEKYSKYLKSMELVDMYYSLDRKSTNREYSISPPSYMVKGEDYSVNSIPVFLLEWCKISNIDMTDISEVHDKAMAYISSVTDGNPHFKCRIYRSFFPFFTQDNQPYISRTSDASYLEACINELQYDIKYEGMEKMLTERLRMTEDEIIDEYSYKIKDVGRIKEYIFNECKKGVYSVQDCMTQAFSLERITKFEERYLMHIMFELARDYSQLDHTQELSAENLRDVLGRIGLED